MKSPSEKGLTAHRLTELRKSHGFTNGPDAAAHVRARSQVVGLGDSVWKAYESGGRPISDKHRAAIEAVLGPIDPPGASAEEAPAGDLSALVAALDRQTAVLTAVLEELRMERTRIPSWLDPAVIAMGNITAQRVVEALRTTEP